MTILDGVTRQIAEGYTLGARPDAKQKFTDATRALTRYVDTVRQFERRGNMAPETAALLTEQASTLQQRLAALGS